MYTISVTFLPRITDFIGARPTNMLYRRLKLDLHYFSGSRYILRYKVNSILAISSVVAGVGVIIAAIIAIYRVIRRIDDAIGKDAQGRTISDRLERVEHQLWENGGSSLADRVNKMNDVTTHTSSQIEIVKEMLVALIAKK